MNRNIVHHTQEDDSSEEEYADATYDGLHSETDHLGSSPSSNCNALTTENSSKAPMSEAELRKKIQEIHANRDMSAKEKARAMQSLMSKVPSSKSQRAPGGSKSNSNIEEWNESDNGEKLEPSYQDTEEKIYGCKHYKRKVKLQANCCGKWYTCRFCHDDVEDHNLIRRETKNMFCMLCSEIQPAAQVCRTCHKTVAHYFCDTCKLWDDDSEKPIYHCDKCGICRQGKGLGEDFFHCEKCNICMVIKLKDKHRCIERNLECDCPICGEYMFTSTSKVIFEKCGHCIHEKCHEEHVKTSYQCPTCLKSLYDMSAYFARIDAFLKAQTMPQEYENFVSQILCNDCEKKSTAKYHFLYHKCSHCNGYNTTVLKTKELDRPEDTGDQSAVSEDALGLDSTNTDQAYIMSSQVGRRTDNPVDAVQMNGTPSSHGPRDHIPQEPRDSSSSLNSDIQ